MISAGAVKCADCGGEVAAGLLSCPSCARLVHSDKLTGLARKAQDAERSGQITEALTAWREASQYLPPGTRQRDAVEAQVRSLSERMGQSGGSPGKPWWKRVSTLGPVGMLAAILGKAKFLLLGFTKLGTAPVLRGGPGDLLGHLGLAVCSMLSLVHIHS